MIYEPTRYYYKCTLDRYIAFNHQLSIMNNCANKILLRNRKLNPGLWDVNIKTERRKKKKKIVARAYAHSDPITLFLKVCLCINRGGSKNIFQDGR